MLAKTIKINTRANLVVMYFLFSNNFQNFEQIIHGWAVNGIVAGIDEAQNPIFVHDEIAAELGGVVAVRFVELAALEPAFDVDPHHARMIRAQARAFESVGLVDDALTVEQDGKRAADFVHPLLECGKRSERDDEDAGIELGKFFLARAQLCGMFAAGYSAKMTQEDEQGVAAFEDFAEGDLFTAGGGQGEVGGGGVEFEFHSHRFPWLGV